eukprot:COSAG02_NODE_15855_length_1136_cov_0.718419_2_plen_106_part_01
MLALSCLLGFQPSGGIQFAWHVGTLKTPAGGYANFGADQWDAQGFTGPALQQGALQVVVSRSTHGSTPDGCSKEPVVEMAVLTDSSALGEDIAWVSSRYGGGLLN